MSTGFYVCLVVCDSSMQLSWAGALALCVWMQSLAVVDKGQDGAITRTAVCDVRLPPLAQPFADRPL